MYKNLERDPQWAWNVRRVLKTWHDKPFVFGETDCTQFALDVAAAMYGGKKPSNVMSAGSYRDFNAGMAEIARHGKSPAELVDTVFTQRITEDEARLGDVSITMALYPSIHVYLRKGQKVTIDPYKGWMDTSHMHSDVIWRA
jgi:hypothetical protein